MKFPIFVKYSVSKNSAALSGSAMGRQQRSSRENRWNTQEMCIRDRISGVLLHKSRDLQFDAGYLGSTEETEPCQSYRERFGLYPYE